MKTLQETIENCKKNNIYFSKEIKTYYFGYDDKNYEAKAMLEIREDGEYSILYYEYFDPEKEVWVDTEERDWDDDVINSEFFTGLDDAEKLAIAMNEREDIPDEAIDEFAVDSKGTLKKYNID